jgi:hypothetical protein
MMVSLLILGACVINPDKWPRPSELSDPWLVDRTRVLAVRADPPEAYPNSTVHFEALVGQAPDDTEELAQVWVACAAEGDGSGFGCVTDPTSLQTDTSSPEPGTDDLEVIGTVPGNPPVYTTPEDLLVGLDEQQAREGLYVLVQVALFPATALEDTGLLPELELADVELAFKRLVVSLATTPNHNPTFDHFTVDGFTVPAGAPVLVEAGEPYELGATLPDGTREVYDYLDTEGVVEQRVEEPYATFLTTSGTIDGWITLWPYMSATFVAPEESGATGKWFVILRDRRGGMGWWVQDWQVR